MTLTLSLFACSNQAVKEPLNKTAKEPEKKQEISEDENVFEDDSAIDLPKTRLQKFDEGEDVQALQNKLIEFGYPIEATGAYDELTVWAITDLQLEFDPKYATGLFDEKTYAMLSGLLENKASYSPGTHLSKPVEANTFTDTIENPYDVLALVNKSHALPSDYEPKDLSVPDVRFPFTEDDPKKQLRQVAADALERLFKAADKAGHTLYAQSGYRSFDRQTSIFNNNVAKHGEKHANTYSARPGQSEHQTGLVMDVTSESVGFLLEEALGETAEGIWLEEEAHQYGFIIRYPKGKESITKYQYEPWHLRYVGVDLASYLVEKDLTLEEYYEKKASP